MNQESEVIRKAKAAAEAARRLATIPTEIKNKALDEMGKAIEKRAKEIMEANKVDVEAAEKKDLSKALIDRLMLGGKRLQGMIEGLQLVKKLPDPIGETIAEWDRPNGLHIIKRRVPLGVIGIIYESRPNVTVDAAGLCLKTGNAVVLRGGSDAINSNIAIWEVISEAAYKAGIPEGAIQLIETTERKAAQELMKLNQYIDVLIPRGGAGLIRTVMENSTIPVIETGVGNCHVYVEKTADLDMAVKIVVNAKCQRPSVCNAAETLLIDEAIAPKFVPKVFSELKKRGVELR